MLREGEKERRCHSLDENFPVTSPSSSSSFFTLSKECLNQQMVSPSQTRSPPCCVLVELLLLLLLYTIDNCQILFALSLFNFFIQFERERERKNRRIHSLTGHISPLSIIIIGPFFFYLTVCVCVCVRVLLHCVSLSSLWQSHTGFPSIVLGSDCTLFCVSAVTNSGTADDRTTDRYCVDP